MNTWQSILAGFALIFINSAYAITSNIVNFPQLVQAVENGGNVRAIVHFDNCLLTQPTNQSNQDDIIKQLEGATTRFNFTQYFHATARINDQLIDTVTTSIKIAVHHPRGEFLLLNGRLSVFEDNTARLRADFSDPLVVQQKLAVEWLCDISNGHDDNGLVLFNFF